MIFLLPNSLARIYYGRNRNENESSLLVRFRKCLFGVFLNLFHLALLEHLLQWQAQHKGCSQRLRAFLYVDV